VAHHKLKFGTGFVLITICGAYDL